MISHQLKCIFVEVPKTGSTSIRSIIGAPPIPHLNICQIRASMAQSPDLFNTYFKFGFVRNPWDRTVSLYNRKEGLQLRNQISFEQFVDWIQFSSATCIHPMPHRYQFDWFVDPHGNLLLDYIGKFENIDKDWEYIRSRIGINAPLPHANRNPANSRHYSEYYNPRTRDIIARKFSVDIERFGYEFLDAGTAQAQT